MSDPNRTSRRWLPTVIVLVATLIGVASVFAIWIKRQALETETWADTSSQLLESPAIQEALAGYLTTAIFDNVDVEAQLAEVLPPPLNKLAGPAAGGLRQLTDNAAKDALAQPKVQALWEDANRTAHEHLLAIINGDSAAVSEAGGAVTLDLTVILKNVAAEVGLPTTLIDKVPADAAQLEVMNQDDLDSIRSGVDALRTLAWLLLAITLALYALAMYLAGSRRRETFRLIGSCFIGVGILVLLGQRAGGNLVVDKLTTTASVEGAASDTWEIATSLLRESGTAVLAYGIAAVIGAWFAGPGSLATSARRGITPYLRQPRFAYGGLAVLLIILFWWDPLIATHRLPTSILLIVLLATGTEFLRRQVIREFPDRVTTWSADGVASRMADRMRDARERRVAVRSAQPAAAASPGSERIDALERLGKLKESGVLSDEELAAEKAKLLGS